MNPKFRPAAAAVALATAFTAFAADAESVSSSEPLAETIVVTATRQVQRANELLSDVTVIGADEIRQAGPAATIADLLARQPGIEIDSRGGPGTAGAVMIRGANGGHTLVLVDGLRVSSATLGEASWGYLPLSEVDRVEIMRGPASSLYGADAIGGVVQIFTRRGKGAPAFTAEAGYGSWETRSLKAGVSGSADALAYSLQVADQRSDGFSATTPKSSAYNPDRDGYAMRNASASLAYTIASGHEVGANVLYSDGWNRYDAFDYATMSGASDYRQDQTVAAYGAYSRNRLLPGWTSLVRVGRGTDDSRQFQDGRQTSTIRTDQDQIQWQNDVLLPVGKALLAVERVKQKVSGDVAYAVSERTIDSWLAGWTGRVDDHRLQFNLRNDENSQFGHKTTGFAGYGYQFTPAWRASVAYGTAFRAPTFNDLYWPDAGNPNLRPETARNREAAVHYEAAGQHASATYYHNSVDDLIDWAPIAPGSWIWQPANVHKADLEGLTLAYAGRVAGFDLRASADFQDARDADTDKQLRYRAREHGSLSVGRTEGPWNWGVEVAGTGKRYNDTANTQVLGGYGVVNLLGGYAIDREWSLFARADNVFDRKYERVATYATPGANVFVGVRYTPR